MAQIVVRGKDPTIVEREDRVDFSLLKLPNSGPSPRGSTYLKSLTSCPREHALRYEARITPRQLSVALARGLVWHLLLELYYRACMVGRAKEGLQRAFEVIERIEQMESDNFKKLGSKLRAMLDVYLENYETTDKWRILAIEETLHYRGAFEWSARLDLIVEDLDRGGMWVVEHKSARTLSSDLLDNYQMDPQILGQVWLVLHCIDLTQYPKFMGVKSNLITTSHTVPRVTRVDVCPSDGHLRMFESFCRGWTQLRTANMKLGWPQALGHCSGYARGYSQCEYFDLCHSYPTTLAQHWIETPDDQLPELYVRGSLPEGEPT